MSLTQNDSAKQQDGPKGFLVNSYSYINASLGGKSIEIKPEVGSAVFIHHYESLTLYPYITVVGVENCANFFNVAPQQYLFEGIQPLFVSRYQQGSDLLKWLLIINNPYLHYSDLDFECINIYQNEYKKHLGDRATFFVPDGIEELLSKYGNRSLYDKQQHSFIPDEKTEEPAIVALVQMMHKHKKVLEQEIFIQK